MTSAKQLQHQVASMWAKKGREKRPYGWLQ
jgi:hypothetical protein